MDASQAFEAVALQGRDTSLKKLYREAKKSRSLLKQAGENIVLRFREEYPGLFENVSFEGPDLKKKKRAKEKIKHEFNGRTQMITDLVRGRIMVHTAEQIEAIRAFLARHAEGLKIRQIKDRFAEPSGTHYRDINIKIGLPNGHVAEIQVNHSHMLEASRETHPLYRQIQAIDRLTESENRMMTEAEALERHGLLEQVRDRHDETAVREGLNILLNKQGQETLENHRRERVLPPYYNPYTGQTIQQYPEPA